MIKLSPEEKILLVLHRHWIVMLGKLFLGALLLLLPVVIAPIISFFEIPAWGEGIIEFLAVNYLMVIIAIMFIFWMDYYLDVWIITTHRIIDIEQKNLFHREISEFMLDKVQDITVEIPNMLATFLKYGNIVVQTAGERSFSIKQIPHLYKAKNIILEYAQKKHERTQ